MTFGLFCYDFVRPSKHKSLSNRKMWLERELNPRHEDFQSSALPTELSSRDPATTSKSGTSAQSQTAGLSLWRNLFRRQAGQASSTPGLSRKQSDAATPLPRSINASRAPWRFPWLRIAGDAASSIVYRAKQTVARAIVRPTPKAQSLTRRSRGGTSTRQKRRRQWRSHTVRRQVR